MKIFAVMAGCCWTALSLLAGQLVISGNENKIDLRSGVPTVVSDAKPDSLSLIDFSVFPPKVTHLENIPNTVIGPPSNIAIHPEGKLALVANSIKLDPANPGQWIPSAYVHVIDLTQTPPRVVGTVPTQQQPSGISFTADGSMALVANRASGTISVLAVAEGKVAPRQTVQVCEPAESLSDVAVSPKGDLALASVQAGGYLAILRIEGDEVRATHRRLSVYGKPYRCVISPDGELAFTAGQGYGNGLDADALSVIDLASDPIQAIQYVAIGASPESLEVSPNGKLVAAVVMNGSNLGADNPFRSDAGGLVILSRKRKTLKIEQKIPIGRIPEGVAFTSNGKYLLVQCHADREIWIFRVRGRKVSDTGRRIEVPGFPSSLRAAP